MSERTDAAERAFRPVRVTLAMLERRLHAIEARQRFHRQHFRSETEQERWRRLEDEARRR